MKLLLSIFASLVLAITLYPEHGLPAVIMTVNQHKLVEPDTVLIFQMVLFQNHIMPAEPIFLSKPAWLLRKKAMA